MHQHVQPKCYVGRGAGCAKCHCARAESQAVGENLAGPGSQVVTEYLEKSRSAEIAERTGL